MSCFNCMAGAMVGDAVGAVVEFWPTVSPAEARRAIALQGGGPHVVGPGQVTDDSELAICLARGLPDGMDAVAAGYCAWLKTQPFDCGRTCATAFTVDPRPPNLASRMTARAAQHNRHSKANGALMRVTPAVVFARSWPERELVALVQADARLSHPNQTTLDCNAAYAVAVRHLLHHPQDGGGALAAARAWAAGATPEVVRWLEEDSAGRRCAQAAGTENTGFVRWAFTLAFHHLRRETAFVDALVDTVEHGGDTDTNAAIVGGMMGAFWGHSPQGVPAAMVDRVVGFDARRDGGHARPAWLSPSQLPQLVARLTA